MTSPLQELQSNVDQSVRPWQLNIFYQKYVNSLQTPAQTQTNKLRPPHLQGRSEIKTAPDTCLNMKEKHQSLAQEKFLKLLQVIMIFVIYEQDVSVGII